jgi:glycosyltransferase involved in cell wall biosynthesis
LREIRKICIVSDWLQGPPDEGIHNLAQNLMNHWGGVYSVRAVRIGADLAVNRLFLSWRLRAILGEIAPDLIVYISSSSVKAAALLRAKVLKFYSPRSRVIVIATQPVAYGRLERRLVPMLAPDGIFVQSPAGKRELEHVRCPVHFLPSGVDTSRFVPVDEIQKRSLRKKHDVEEDAFIVLHVGHINRGRNVQVLENVVRLKDVRVILVGSTSTEHDEVLARQLFRAGVRLIREFVPRVEEIYQLADAYLFPVVLEGSAIGVPLSVLEAMSCNLPVITTRFGGFPWMFPGGDGFTYFDDEKELPELLEAVRGLETCSTRRMVEPYDWKKVAPAVIEMIAAEDSSQ